MNYSKYSRIIFLAVVLALVWFITRETTPTSKPKNFDRHRAYLDVVAQGENGPRTPGSESHAQTRKYIMTELAMAGWDVVEYEFVDPITSTKGYNLVASRSASPKKIILGAHYDSRMQADNETDQVLRSQPVPGANDGASGVAVLLEIGRTLDRDITNVDLVFFDLEDQGGIDGFDWILGSRAFVDRMEENPAAMVLLDMVGNKDSIFHFEANSDNKLRAQIWDTAHSLGHADQFPMEEKFAVLDDHIPFIEKGIPAVDIIDLDDPNWHKLSDDTESISEDTLFAVGDTVLNWIRNYNVCLIKQNCKDNG